MAKKAKKSAAAKHTVAHPSYAGNKYSCYGKRVRSGKGSKKSPRVYCGKVEAA